MSVYVCEIIRGGAFFADPSPGVKLKLEDQWLIANYRGQEEHVNVINDYEAHLAQIFFANNYVRFVYSRLAGGGSDIFDRLEPGYTDIIKMADVMIVLQLPH